MQFFNFLDMSFENFKQLVLGHLDVHFSWELHRIHHHLSDQNVYFDFNSILDDFITILKNWHLCLSLSKRKWEGGAKHSRAFFDDLLLARGPFIQASVWRGQLLLVKRAIPDIWSKNLSRVRVFLTILHSSDWNLSHSHVLDDSQNAWECFAPPQLLKRFVWDKNSIHLINRPIFRIRAEKIISLVGLWSKLRAGEYRSSG